MNRFFTLLISVLFFFNPIQDVIGQIQFDQVASDVGIDFLSSASKKLGAGCAFFDYNNDGFEDLYIIGGVERDMLYKNNGNGTFTEVGQQSGMNVTLLYDTFGVVTGDLNGDGYRDIVVTTDKPDRNLLFKNNGGNTFSEIGESAGLTHVAMSYAPSLGDYDNDGDLDIYIGNYIDVGGIIYDQNNNPIGYDHDCHPNFMYRNDGSFTFTEVGQSLDIDDEGCALSTVWTDFDNDNDIDMMVCNDFGEWTAPNALFKTNSPGNTLEDISVPSNMNAELYCMGIAVSDFDHDNDLDYYFTNIGRNLLLQNNNDETFIDVTTQAGVENAIVNNVLTTSWGDAFLDINNDTWDDLFVVNGWIALAFLDNELHDPDKLYLNNGDGTFDDISELAGVDNTFFSRAMAFSDFDNDGDLDIVVVAIHWLINQTEHVLFYKNESATNNHWLQVKLIGQTSNKEAYGTHMIIHTGGDSWRHEIVSASSHSSQNTTIAHFGLGTNTIVDSLEVFWPKGKNDVFYNIQGDQRIEIDENDGIIFTNVHEQTIPGVSFVRNGENAEFIFSDGINSQEWLIQVTNAHGQLTQSHNLNYNQSRFSLSEKFKLPKGVYFVHLSSGFKKQTFKWIN